MTTLQNIDMGRTALQADATAASALSNRLHAVGRAVARNIGRGVKRVQYGRMMSIMHQFDDRQLARLGLTRDELPVYVHAIIYGEE